MCQLLVGFLEKNGGEKNKVLLKKFVDSSNEAKKLMLNSDEIWSKVRPSMNIKDDETFNNLRQIYREGIPQKFGDLQIEGAGQLFKILSKIGGKELVGNANELSEGTFWID